MKNHGFSILTSMMSPSFTSLWPRQQQVINNLMPLLSKSFNRCPICRTRQIIWMIVSILAANRPKMQCFSPSTTIGRIVTTWPLAQQGSTIRPTIRPPASSMLLSYLSSQVGRRLAVAARPKSFSLCSSSSRTRLWSRQQVSHPF